MLDRQRLQEMVSQRRRYLECAMNACSVRVTPRTSFQPLGPNERDVQEPTCLQSIHDACVPLFAIPALGAARHVQVARKVCSHRQRTLHLQT
jgi:hypothetical protein